LDAFGEFTFIARNCRSFGLTAVVLPCRINNFKPGAVTDSNLLLIERSFGAASAGFHAQYFERFRTGRMQPENMAYSGILRYKTEIKDGIGDGQFRLGKHHPWQKQKTKRKQSQEFNFNHITSRIVFVFQ
jgi:hypothetical protein